MLLKLSQTAKHNLIGQGYELWVNNLAQHIEACKHRFDIIPIRVIHGGHAGLILLCFYKKSEKLVVLKTQPSGLSPHAQALSLLTEIPGIPKIIDFSENLQAMLINYIDGEPVSPGGASLEEYAEIINSWKTVDASLLTPLSEWVPVRIKRAWQLVDIIGKSASRENLGLLRQAQYNLEVSEKLTHNLLEDFEKQPNSFLHLDLGPHNLIRTKTGALIPIDIHGGFGSPGYDVASSTALFSNKDFNDLPKRVTTLASLTETDLEKSLGWSAFRATTFSLHKLSRGEKTIAKGLIQSSIDLLNELK